MLCSSAASAQQPAPAAQQPAGPAPQLAPFTMPTAPNIDDPMLAPAPPAKREIKSWQEAIQLVRARSTDLATAYAEVRRAEAQMSSSLAGKSL